MALRAEIPIDYNSGDTQSYLKEYRNADVNRTQRWKERGPKVNQILYVSIIDLSAKREDEK